MASKRKMSVISDGGGSIGGDWEVGSIELSQSLVFNIDQRQDISPALSGEEPLGGRRSVSPVLPIQNQPNVNLVVPTRTTTMTMTSLPWNQKVVILNAADPSQPANGNTLESKSRAKANVNNPQQQSGVEEIKVEVKDQEQEGNHGDGVDEGDAVYTQLHKNSLNLKTGGLMYGYVRHVGQNTACEGVGEILEFQTKLSEKEELVSQQLQEIYDLKQKQCNHEVEMNVLKGQFRSRAKHVNILRETLYEDLLYLRGQLAMLMQDGKAPGLDDPKEFTYLDAFKFLEEDELPGKLQGGKKRILEVMELECENAKKRIRKTYEDKLLDLKTQLRRMQYAVEASRAAEWSAERRATDVEKLANSNANDEIESIAFEAENKVKAMERDCEDRLDEKENELTDLKLKVVSLESEVEELNGTIAGLQGSIDNIAGQRVVAAEDAKRDAELKLQEKERDFVRMQAQVVQLSKDRSEIALSASNAHEREAEVSEKLTKLEALYNHDKIYWEKELKEKEQLAAEEIQSLQLKHQKVSGELNERSQQYSQRTKLLRTTKDIDAGHVQTLEEENFMLSDELEKQREYSERISEELQKARDALDHLKVVSETQNNEKQIASSSVDHIKHQLQEALQAMETVKSKIRPMYGMLSKVPTQDLENAKFSLESLESFVNNKEVSGIHEEQIPIVLEFADNIRRSLLAMTKKVEIGQLMSVSEQESTTGAIVLAQQSDVRPLKEMVEFEYGKMNGKEKLFYETEEDRVYDYVEKQIKILETKRQFLAEMRRQELEASQRANEDEPTLEELVEQQRTPPMGTPGQDSLDSEALRDLDGDIVPHVKRVNSKKKGAPSVSGKSKGGGDKSVRSAKSTKSHSAAARKYLNPPVEVEVQTSITWLENQQGEEENESLPRVINDDGDFTIALPTQQAFGDEVRTRPAPLSDLVKGNESITVLNAATSPIMFSPVSERKFSTPTVTSPIPGSHQSTNAEQGAEDSSAMVMGSPIGSFFKATVLTQDTATMTSKEDLIASSGLSKADEISAIISRLPPKSQNILMEALAAAAHSGGHTAVEEDTGPRKGNASTSSKPPAALAQEYSQESLRSAMEYVYHGVTKLCQRLRKEAREKGKGEGNGASSDTSAELTVQQWFGVHTNTSTMPFSERWDSNEALAWLYQRGQQIGNPTEFLLDVMEMRLFSIIEAIGEQREALLNETNMYMMNKDVLTSSSGKAQHQKDRPPLASSREKPLIKAVAMVRQNRETAERLQQQMLENVTDPSLQSVQGANIPSAMEKISYNVAETNRALRRSTQQRSFMPVTFVDFGKEETCEMLQQKMVLDQQSKHREQLTQMQASHDASFDFVRPSSATPPSHRQKKQQGAATIVGSKLFEFPKDGGGSAVPYDEEVCFEILRKVKVPVNSPTMVTGSAPMHPRSGSIHEDSRPTSATPNDVVYLGGAVDKAPEPEMSLPKVWRGHNTHVLAHGPRAHSASHRKGQTPTEFIESVLAKQKVVPSTSSHNPAAEATLAILDRNNQKSSNTIKKSQSRPGSALPTSSSSPSASFAVELQRQHIAIQKMKGGVQLRGRPSSAMDVRPSTFQLSSKGSISVLSKPVVQQSS